MNILYISGSPRRRSNTDFLLELVRKEAGGELVKLSDYRVMPCRSCWHCRERCSCVLDDDVTQVLIPRLLSSAGLVIGSPVYFNNVSAQLKALMDRTWSIRGKLRNKVGGTVVVGRRYGAEGAITAINAFFLKHEMIPANRGVHGIAFEEGDIERDEEATASAQRLGRRIKELLEMIPS